MRERESFAAVELHQEKVKWASAAYEEKKNSETENLTWIINIYLSVSNEIRDWWDRDTHVWVPGAKILSFFKNRCWYCLNLTCIKKKKKNLML